jgi:hypothetical protein
LMATIRVEMIRTHIKKFLVPRMQVGNALTPRLQSGDRYEDARELGRHR